MSDRAYSYQFDSPSPEQFALAQEHAKNRVFAYRQNAARLARLNDTVKRLSRYDPNHDLWRALIERDSLEAHQGKERVWVNASFRAREHSRRPPRSQVVFDPALRAELADTSPRKRPPETYLGGY